MVNLNFRADGDFGPLIAEVNRAMAQLSKFRNTQLLGNLNLNKKDFDAPREMKRAWDFITSNEFHLSIRNLAMSMIKMKKLVRTFS